MKIRLRPVGQTKAPKCPRFAAEQCGNVSLRQRNKSLGLRFLALALLFFTAFHPLSGRTALLEITNRADARFISSPGQTNFVFSGSVSVIADAAQPDPVVGLFVEKTASRNTVEIGEFLDYTLRIKNVSSNTLAAVTVTDLLPAGFAYVRDSTRVNGARARDPTGGSGPRLEFTAGPVPANDTLTLAYRVRIGPGAVQGDARNSAQASSEGPPRLLSNIAEASVLVGGGVFSERAIIFGKVFVDVNTNRIQDANEPGVPGIRLYLEDGTYAITDDEGKYSIYGLRALTHVVKVDRTSLPAGAKLLPLSNHHSTNGGMCMVELHRGEFHKTDFALDGRIIGMREQAE